MLASTLRIVLLIVFALTPAFSQLTPAPKSIIAYLFPQERVIVPQEIDTAHLTRINYAFANLKNGRLIPGFPQDAENLRTLVSLKHQHPHLQILISVGGWSWSGGFSDMALTHDSRARFIESAAAFIADHGLDGIDIDWEYPGQTGSGNKHRAQDKENFTALLQELRHRLDGESKRLSRPLLTSIAAGASEEFIANTDMAEVQSFVESINLMTYDFYVPGVDGTTGHHAPLSVNPRDPKQVSAIGAVELFEHAGVPAAKIVLGVPFYGHAWTHVKPRDNGLYQRGKKGMEDPDYKAIQGLLSHGGFQRHWDAIAKAPYLYSEDKQIFISYEDPESLRWKCDYIAGHHLGGVMFWEYSHDAQGELLGTLSRLLNPEIRRPGKRY